MRNPDSYPASTIDAKLDAIIRMIDGLAAVMNAKFEAVDRRFEAVDRRFETLAVVFTAKLEGEVRRLDTKIDGLRNEVRIWVVVAAIVISPLITTLMTRAAAVAWPLPGAPSSSVR